MNTLSKKDILLISPSYNDTIVNNAHLPVGLSYVAQSIENNGYTYDICDLNVQPIDTAWKFLKNTTYKYIGIGMMSYYADKTYALVLEIKNKYPHLIVILGGPHVIAVKEKIFKECPEVDLLVRGEGEETIIDIFQKKDLNDIPGIYFRKNDEIIETEDRGIIKNFDSIPFPKYSQLDLNLYENGMLLSSSRGCPYKCTFCGAPTFLGKKWRKKTSNSMFEEFYYWYEKGIRYFKFEDSLFSADKNRIFEFCELVIDLKDPSIRFDVDGARCDHFNYDLLKKMREANFTRLVFGVESANDHVLKSFKKGETIKQIDDTITIANELKFYIGMFFIIGGPDETVEDAKRSFNFALKFKYTETVFFFRLTPVVGTPYFDYALEQGYVSENEKYPSGNFGFENISELGNNCMNSEELSELLIEARHVEKKVQLQFKNRHRIYNQEKNKSVTKDLNYLYDMIEFHKNSNRKFLIYGAGKPGKIIASMMGDQVLGFIDIDALNKRVVMNKNVYLPNEIKELVFDEILICTLGREEKIKSLLVDELKIDEYKINVLEF